VAERRWARVSFLYICCDVGVGPRWAEIKEGKQSEGMFRGGPFIRSTFINRF